MGNAFYMEKFVQLKQFDNVQDMDDYIKDVLYYYADQLTPSAKKVLDVLKQHALKVVGVAYIKVALLVELTGLKERTVRAATALLAKLGIINKVETLRPKKGGDGANAYVISACSLPCRAQTAGRQEPENLGDSKDEQTKTESKSLNPFKALLKTKDKINEKHIETYVAKEENIVDFEIYENIPTKIRKTLTHLRDGKLANAVWKKTLQAFVRTGLQSKVGVYLQQLLEDSEDLTQQLQRHVYNAVRLHERRELTSDIFGYIYAHTFNLFDAVLSEIGAKERAIGYNWLEA